MGRGPHGADPSLFAAAARPGLVAAVQELSWLLGRGYAETSALALVGDRHRLRKRQRIAVRRCACSDGAVRDRSARRLEPEQIRGRELAIDGFNCIITIEAALAGGVILRGRDGALRDLASVHGSYRRVATTAAALAGLARLLAACEPAAVTWYLDRPVSNSGRLREAILAAAPDRGWQVELPFDPDRVLRKATAVVATSDASILDAPVAWVDLPAAVIEREVPDAWVVDLS